MPNLCSKPLKKLFGLFLLAGFCFGPYSVFAGDEKLGEELVAGQCSSCHKFEGKQESKFNLKAPDLMWGGVKYQRPWLIRWLTGKEPNLYPNGYRWDKVRKQQPHIVLSSKEANAVADYFEKNLRDPRIKGNPIDFSNFSEKEAEFGAEIYKEFSCFACHQIKENGKIVGGPISVDLFDSGNRYDSDWLYQFALNPQDFTPHSGEYVADLSPLGVRYILGFLMTQGLQNYQYFEPWKTEYFRKANPDSGAQVYEQYCTQCHGAKGEGDGPGAEGLFPKPAIHAKMALSDFPEDYLFNLVYYGGKSVGKSPNMPDWGLTLQPQELANVISFLRTNFKGDTITSSETMQSSGKSPQHCPQKRNTKNFSSKYIGMKNPLKPSADNLMAGENLFQKSAKPMACKICHGEKGDGKGPAAAGFSPPPRNFTCAETMTDLPDGQLFGIIKEGSSGTAMPAFKNLQDEQVWQLIHYIRQFIQ